MIKENTAFELIALNKFIIIKINVKRKIDKRAFYPCEETFQ